MITLSDRQKQNALAPINSKADPDSNRGARNVPPPQKRSNSSQSTPRRREESSEVSDQQLANAEPSIRYN
jgi:hypothetical protein